MKRGLSKQFETDLISGKLKRLLSFVLNDNSLDMEIRENYINIYYRGGNSLKVSVTGREYIFDFDYNYLTIDSTLKIEIEKSLTDKNWLHYFAFTKQVMDLYFTSHRKEEREYQQLVVRENNYSSIANGTDYFIIDIEYDNHKNAIFDIVAVEWISESSKRKLLKSYKPKIVVFEMKYGDGALSGKAGMVKHLDDFKSFILNPLTIQNFKREMLEVFKQKRRLGLIPCLSESSNKNEVIGFDEEINFSFLLANHDPASIKLKQQIESSSDFFASFIIANFSGYGLYKNNIISATNLLKKFPDQVYEL